MNTVKEDAARTLWVVGHDAPFFLMLTPLRKPGLVSIRSLIPSASFVGCADISVSTVTEYSQDCTPGCLFAALPGTRTHGREHVNQALLGGAAAILTDRPLAEIALPQCIVPDARQVYGRICHGLYAFPSQKLGVAGVTGTNGKTTTTWILRSLLTSASYPTGVIGTIEYTDGIESQPSSLTTPDALTMARVLAAMRDRHTTHAAMELSSHALKQGRAAGVQLDVGVVTNITHDHQDYHESFDDYLNSKAKISTLLKESGTLVLNADDPHCQQLRERIRPEVRVWTFGIASSSDVTASEIQLSPEGTRFRLHFRAESIECRTSLTGMHNVSNCLAAASAALHFGLTLKQIADGLQQAQDVPGRLQKVSCGQPFQVYVDYAHTDDALQRVIDSVRAVTAGRVILVFGAGGDRDRAKRPLMARAASAADHVILTSDNPRSEDPNQIIQEILTGFVGSSIGPVVQIDRKLAIQQAIQFAQPGDAVIVAGKGHEKIQILGDQHIRFDDVEVCQEALRTRSHSLQGMHVHPESVRV